MALEFPALDQKAAKPPHAGNEGQRQEHEVRIKYVSDDPTKRSFCQPMLVGVLSPSVCEDSKATSRWAQISIIVSNVWWKPLPRCQREDQVAT